MRFRPPPRRSRSAGIAGLPRLAPADHTPAGGTEPKKNGGRGRHKYVSEEKHLDLEGSMHNKSNGFSFRTGRLPMMHINK
jgi:hypothetical protein